MLDVTIVSMMNSFNKIIALDKALCPILMRIIIGIKLYAYIEDH